MGEFDTRREFLRRIGVSGAVLPFVWNLPSLCHAGRATQKQRLVIVFSPNGVVPEQFWPTEEGAELRLPEILKPLAPVKDRVLTLQGVCNRVRGDGDSHMRGMSCLLTGIELFPGNIQGGSHTPAGWASGISIDQEIKNFFQSRPEHQSRFGSLELGVAVPHRADPWTRMVYAGPNKPVAPIDDPYLVLRKLYGGWQDQKLLAGILDSVCEDLHTVRAAVSLEDRQLLDEHATLVRDFEAELRGAASAQPTTPPLELEPDVKNVNDSIPKLSTMQIDLLVNSFASDFARVATLQYTNSVGQARMRWLGIEEAHHELSHHPDSNKDSQEKLTRINQWFAQQLAYLAQRLAETPEPGGDGTLLDHTLIIWTNELGAGNNHTLNDIPFVLIGNGFGFRMGRALRYKRVPHNRLLLALAHAVGHRLETFGKPALCEGGVLNDLV